MHRLLEILLGLDRGFLSRQGELSLQFNPPWPWQDVMGAGVWNFLLVCAAVALVLYVYRREGRSRPARISLGVLRALLLLFLIALLNRPVLTLVQSRVEPSVVAILIDDSVSMRVRDAALTATSGPAESDRNALSRLEAVVQLLSSDDQAFLRALAKRHTLRLFRFDQDAEPIGSTSGDPQSRADVARAVEKLAPDGQNTQLIASLHTVIESLQGQRLAGVVVLSDGRETPSRPLAEALAGLKNFGVKIYPVIVGSDREPRNVEIQTVNVQDSAFKGDIVNVRATIRATGFEPGRQFLVQLKDKKTGKLLPGIGGAVAEQKVTVDGDKPTDVEVQFKPTEIGPLDVQVEIAKEPGELDDADNIRVAQVSVLDAKIAVLYVDGYPRWDYRYLKNEMIRDRTVDISCLLLSALGTGFAQEGDKPITRFPESIEEMLQYDVVIFGDVDPRQLGDQQLQLISDFVSRRGGGFGMVAGLQFSPQAYRNTAIEPILPVNIARVETTDTAVPITQGFRPVLTPVGASSSIFRFFADRAVNEKFIRDDLPPMFWYCRGVTAKPGVGETYAEHPTDVGPDGRKAPILVLGRFGAGRTLFSAIDDSWRWRFYTGESVFDTYWVQQLRYLARSKKLGQRRLTLVSQRPSYELGEQARLSLRVLDPQLLQQLPEQIRVQITDEAGQPVRNESLVRQEGQNDLYVASFTADRVGRFVVKLPAVAGGVAPIDVPLEVITPRLELSQPEVDRTLLTRLASETLGQTVELTDARTKLPAMIASAAKIIPIESSQSLWDAPLAMAIFVSLLTVEWVMRKMYGML